MDEGALRALQSLRTEALSAWREQKLEERATAYRRIYDRLDDAVKQLLILIED